jgi:serine/threonine protein phosphatase 1
MLTFAIGDVHGCIEKLERLLAACDSRAGGREARFICLGDYIDRGPESRAVVELLMRRQAATPGTMLCLRGNHEQLALDAHADASAVPLWLHNGAGATLASYPEGQVEPAHLAWLATLPLCHDDGLRFFVHAGVDLDVPLERQEAETMLWIREPFLSGCDSVDLGRFIVHGHTPQASGRPDLRRHRVNLDTGAVIGGPLTAAVLEDGRPQPIGFLTDEDA